MNDVSQSASPAAETRNSIEDIWGSRMPYAGEGQWPERTDSRMIAAAEKWVQSACVLCSNGCALDIGVAGNRIVGVRGRGCDPVNRGRLGPKGLHGWEANHSPDRLTLPRIRKSARAISKPSSVSTNTLSRAAASGLTSPKRIV